MPAGHWEPRQKLKTASKSVDLYLDLTYLVCTAIAVRGRRRTAQTNASHGEHNLVQRWELGVICCHHSLFCAKPTKISIWRTQEKGGECLYRNLRQNCGKMATTWCHTSLLWTLAIPKTWAQKKKKNTHTQQTTQSLRILWSSELSLTRKSKEYLVRSNVWGLDPSVKYAINNQ